MAKINISIDATVQDFSTFADELGYMSEVSTLVEGVPTSIPNPQNKQGFLEERIGEIVIDALYRRKAQALDQVTVDTKVAEKAAIRAAIRNAVTVTSTV